MNLSKKLLALALSVIMIVSVLPLNAFADDAEVKSIENVDVTINLDDIANQPATDFVKRISVNQEGLMIGDSPRVTRAGDTVVAVETVEPGKEYWVSFVLYVEDGYTLNGYTYNEGYDGSNITVSVNGEKFGYYYNADINPLKFNSSTFSVYPQHHTQNGPLRICLYYSFEVPEEPDFFERIVQAIEKLFEPIIVFFTETLAQSFADLFMKFS